MRRGVCTEAAQPARGMASLFSQALWEDAGHVYVGQAFLVSGGACCQILSCGTSLPMSPITPSPHAARRSGGCVPHFEVRTAVRTAEHTGRLGASLRVRRQSVPATQCRATRCTSSVISMPGSYTVQMRSDEQGTHLVALDKGTQLRTCRGSRRFSGAANEERTETG